MIRIIYLLFTVVLYYQIGYSQEWHYYSSSAQNIPSDHVNCVLVDQNNNKWFGTDNGLVSYNGTEWRIHQIQARIHNISENKFGASDELWLSTDQGLIRIEVESASSISIINTYDESNSGIVHNDNLNIAFDSTSAIWIGTSMGLSILNGEAWSNFTVNDSIDNVQNEFISIVPFNKVKDVKHRENGMVNTDKSSAYNYIATEGAGINRLKYDEVDGITGASKFDTEWSQLPSDTINTIFFDSRNIAWYGTNHGLAMHGGDNIKRNMEIFTTAEGLANDTVLTIMEDHDLNIWVGTAQGVSVYTGGIWKSWDTHSRFAGDSVNAIAEDSTGSIWLCTNNGILNFTPDLTALSGQNKAIVSSFDLSSYPNPFNSTTVIHYTINETGDVHLIVMDMLGKTVADLVNTRQNPGNYNIQFKADHLASGIYVCRLSTERKSMIIRMLLMK